MGFFDLFKEKITEPTAHEAEDNIVLTEGAHVLTDCKNVSLSGTAIVLESTNTDYLDVIGRSKIQIMNSGSVKTLGGKAKIGLIKTGSVYMIKDKSSITTVNDGHFDYVKGKAKIGTFNKGSIKFIDDKAIIETINTANIMFIRNEAKIGTMINGSIKGMLDKTSISTLMNGKIDYMLNKSSVGTMNMGEVGELCDVAEINTQNDGNVNFMMGSAIVYQQIGGKIKSKSGNSIVIYTQKKERLSAVAKESVTDAEPKKKASKKLKSETQEEIKTEETKPKNSGICPSLISIMCLTRSNDCIRSVLSFFESLKGR